ncbi:MAG: toxin-antitoxin system HicB family antitoxin [Glaciecola sp.]
MVTCKKLSKTPNTSCKGSFNVRTRSDLHVQTEKYQEQTKLTSFNIANTCTYHNQG